MLDGTSSSNNECSIPRLGGEVEPTAVYLTNPRQHERLADVLSSTTELLSDESRWTRRRSAENAHGAPCAPTSKDARKWCLVGGYFKATRDVLTVLPSGIAPPADTGGDEAWIQEALIKLLTYTAQRIFPDEHRAWRQKVMADYPDTGFVAYVNDQLGYGAVQVLLDAAGDDFAALRADPQLAQQIAQIEGERDRVRNGR